MNFILTQYGSQWIQNGSHIKAFTAVTETQTQNLAESRQFISYSPHIIIASTRQRNYEKKENTMSFGGKLCHNIPQ